VAKERSPNFPYVGLAAAVQAARKLYEAERRSPVTLEAVARAFGHATMSGPATSKVAAIRQYGLIEQVSPGKYRVSDDALALALRKPGDSEYEEALRKAALTPPLFAELFKAYPEASDETLRWHLVKERSFSPEGAARLIRSFRDTISVAKLTPGSYTPPSDEAENGADDEVELPRNGTRDGGSGAGPTLPRQPRRIEQRDNRGVDSVAYSWPLGSGNSVQLIFSGEPTQKNIDILLAQLQIVREIAPTEAPAPQPAAAQEEPVSE
jgi:hypothetical protein